jgi:carboxypeptidase family protein
MGRIKRRLVVALSALCVALWAIPSAAQVYTGRIDVTVTDSTGALLPGATVEAMGPQRAVGVSDTRGEVHLLNLPPGTYVVTAKLSGFTDYKNENVPVGSGVSVPLTIALGVGGVATAVEVTAESPIIDTKKNTVATNVSLDELQNIPSSRDPWVVLQTVPGIIVDRVNVGGAESGQQSAYQAKGADTTDNTWNLDGIAITDMAAVGATPTYYDFDMFQEMQVTTGGADPANPTPGVHLNFVLRGGTSQWRASGRYYFENEDLQSDNIDEENPGQPPSYNRIKKYRDYGLEGGGPIIPNRLFAWGAWGKTEPALRIFNFVNSAGAPCAPGTAGCAYQNTAKDETFLENYAAKVTGEITQKSRATFMYFRGNKEKFGRGASATRPDETTYNQTGPVDVYKVELNQTLGTNLFLSGRYAKTNGGFSLEPRGGRDTQRYVDDDGVNHNTFGFYLTDRPQDNVAVDGNYFKGRHELKFGFGWRKAAVTSESGFPGGLYSVHNGYPAMDVTIVRNWAAAGEGIYWSAYVGDTISLNRLTLNAGLRWGRASNNVLEASVPANPLSPLLPALTATRQDDAIVFNAVTPRVGFTYAVDDARRTIVRGSYALFTSQLGSALAASTVSQIPYYSYVYYSVVDTNGNKIADPAELAAGTFEGTAGFNPSNPLEGNPDKIGDYATPLTHEVLFGIDHELARNFGVSATVTWRHFNNFNWLHYRGVTGSDFTQAGTLTGTADPVGNFSVPFYVVNSDAFPEDFGRVYEKRDDYHQRYLGFETAATKRMSNNWMMRLGFSTNVHREYFDSVDAMRDPTSTLSNPTVDGGLVMRVTGGSGKSSIYMVLPQYQFIATGAYQWRWGVNFGMNYVARQGYAEPFFRSRTPGSADETANQGKQVLIVNKVDDFRLPAVHSFDARISKEFRAQRFRANFDVDFFNLFNSSTELGREFDRRLATYNTVREIMNPRIVRFGVRLGF